MWLGGGGREPRRWKRRGSDLATFMRRPPSKLVLPWHGPLPLSKSACVADGGSGRSRSPAADLPQSAMSGGVLGLHALRPRAALLLPALPRGRPAAAMPRSQPPSPMQSGRPAGSSGPATDVPPTSRNRSRDGSIFPFGHFSATIRLWRNDHDAGGVHATDATSRPTGKTGRLLAGLLHLRPARPLRRSLPTHSTTKVKLDDQPGNPRTDSPLFLR